METKNTHETDQKEVTGLRIQFSTHSKEQELDYLDERPPSTQNTTQFKHTIPWNPPSLKTWINVTYNYTCTDRRSPGSN